MSAPGFVERRFWAIAVALMLAGAVLRAPAFEHEFAADDYAQLAMMEGVFPSPRSPLSLFTFSSGDPADVQRLMDAGFYPWFSHPTLRLSMMRPLGSLLMWIDHSLFGRQALGYHVHSLLWWLGLLWASAWVCRRLLGSSLGLLALSLFVLDETHGVMMGWIANRNAIASALLCLLALGHHVRAREQGQSVSMLALGLFALALAFGEYALCMLGYFIAYELVVGRSLGSAPDGLAPRGARYVPLAPWLGRYVPLAPWLAGGLVFLGLRAALGYGSYGSDLYVDPLRTPLAFAQVALERFPVLASDLVAGLRSDWWTFGVPPPLSFLNFGHDHEPWSVRLGRWRTFQEWVGWSSLLIALLGVGLARGSGAPGGRSSPTAWLALGALLAMVPPLVTAPSTRSLVGPAWGLAAVLGVLLARVPELWRTRRRLTATLACGLLSVHLVLAPLLGFADTFQMTQIANVVRATALDPGLDPLGLEGKRVIFLSSAEPITPIYFSLIRRLHDRPTPRSTWLLCTTSAPFTLSRPGPAELELSLDDRQLLDGGFERIFRTARAPVAVGHRFRVDGMTATVLALQDGKPSRLRFEFEAALSDPRYVVLAATARGFRPHRLPEVGATLQIGAPVLPTALPIHP